MQSVFRRVTGHIDIRANRRSVWRAWTTEAGTRSYFAPSAKIEASPGGHLQHGGWGNGEEWDKAIAYFEHAWLKIVLPRLKYYLEIAAIDWSNPPTL